MVFLLFCDIISIGGYIELSHVKHDEIIRKIPYWQNAGKVYLDGILATKWCLFVEEIAQNNGMNGYLLDETLQLISMIKSNVSIEQIANVAKEIPDYEAILNSYLPAFIHMEIIEEIMEEIQIKKR